MNKKNSIRIACAIAVSISVFLMTCFLSLLIIKTTLGNTAYAIKAPLILPLSFLASLFTARIFSVKQREEEYTEEDIEYEEDEQITKSEEGFVQPELDESVYPELFKSKNEKEIAKETKRPDIKALLHEQSGVFEAEAKEEKKEEFPEFKLEIEETKPSTLYSDIPTELPEDYVPYEYKEDEEEAEEEEYYEIAPFQRVIFKTAIALIASILAVIIPINCSTVYSTDSITVRRPFSKKEYRIADANHYTIGVKISGDISMKLHFNDGTDMDVIFPDLALKSTNFKSSFSSQYAYAAFCNRLLLRTGVEKRFEDINFLSPSASLSQKDLAYIEEIAETDLTP